MNDRETTPWPGYFESEGYADSRVLGQGMEGTVYALGDGRVAKVWFNRKLDEVRRLEAFFSHLAGQGLPFRTPEFLGVGTHAGQVVSVERELSGTPLSDAMSSGAVSIARGKECVLEIMSSLRRTSGGPACRELTVIDETTALWAGHADWPGALGGLIDRRVARYGDHLRAAVTDFDGRLERIHVMLTQLPSVPRAVMHGDLFPENILVDDDGEVTAVLDWGFLTTEADPAFDASVTASIFDMYGSAHRAIDEELLGRLSEAGGYPMEHLLLYRAVYAVLTSNAYDPTGQDGHFAWCAAMLDRPDVVDALSGAGPSR